MPLASRPDYTLEMVLAEYERSLADDGIADGEVCNAVRWLRENVGSDKTVADFDAFVAADLEQGPMMCWQIARDCYRYNEGEAALEIQRQACEALVRYPFKLARGYIEQLLNQPLKGPWDLVAQRILVAAVLAGHRRPKAFLGQDTVRQQLPVGFDLGALPDDPEPA